MKQGVPWHTALGLDPGEEVELDDAWRLAMTVILGQLEGGKYNWQTLSWEKDDDR